MHVLAPICPSTLLDMTCQIANVLKSDGVKKGDRVAIYMPVSPMLVASMMACARIGAIHRYVHIQGHCNQYTMVYFNLPLFNFLGLH